MIKIALFPIILLVVFAGSGNSQAFAQQNRSPVHVALEFSMIFPSQLLLSFEDTAQDSTGTYSYLTTTSPSFRFGGYLRFELFGNHSLETGLYRITRKYKSSVSVLETGQELGSNSIRGVAFELPLVWTISVPLSPDSKLSTGFGGVMSYFASDFGVFDLQYNLDAVIRSRFLGGIKANLGFEYDMGAEGGVYFGATFQHHFQPKAFLRMEYFEQSDAVSIAAMELNGSYLAAVVRYIFPAQ